MSGRLAANYRSGHLAQDEASLLLRRLCCALADVRQSDDYGLDGIATILRSEGKLQYPEESFFVQIKSKAKREVVYKGNECSWLRSLNLPMFICSIDPEFNQAELFTTHNVSCLPYFPYHSVTLYLDNHEQSAIDGHLHVPLGLPVLRWNGRDCHSGKVKEHLYAILKHWVVQEQKHVMLTGLGHAHQLRWETNELPTVTLAAILGGDTSTMKSDMAAAAPHLMRLALHAMEPVLRGEAVMNNETAGFVLLSDWFARNGVQEFELPLRAVNLLTDRAKRATVTDVRGQVAEPASAPSEPPNIQSV